MDPTRLRVAGIKATFPRLKILDIFHQHADQHMSAADIYRSLISEHSSIGLATVYRVITQLEDAGVLKRTQLDAHTTVYELNDKGHHDHLVCLDCGRVEEFFDAEIEKRQQMVAKSRGFVLQEHALSLYANCSKGECPHRGNVHRAA